MCFHSRRRLQVTEQSGRGWKSRGWTWAMLRREARVAAAEPPLPATHYSDPSGNTSHLPPRLRPPSFFRLPPPSVPLSLSRWFLFLPLRLWPRLLLFLAGPALSGRSRGVYSSVLLHIRLPLRCRSPGLLCYSIFFFPPVVASSFRPRQRRGHFDLCQGGCCCPGPGNGAS